MTTINTSQELSISLVMYYFYFFLTYKTIPYERLLSLTVLFHLSTMADSVIHSVFFHIYLEYLYCNLVFDPDGILLSIAWAILGKKQPAAKI